MCGISGFYDSDGDMTTLSAMMASMAHRGPDNASCWHNEDVGLAHNRLSIIDISDRSNQPLHYMHAHIVLNGEIYNYIELRDELRKKGYSFNTESDTEVAAAAYCEWGERCVERFNGMWALAIWNSNEKILFCSRDRFGIKPLYYIFRGNKLYFGSEYKPLKKTPVFMPEINVKQIARGLQIGWSFYEDETYFECIRRLPAAHNISYDGKNMKIYRYWDIDLSKKNYHTQQEVFKTFRELFEDSVKLQLRSDVKIGACLSGGIDSSSIVSMVSHLKPELNFETFTIFYDGEKEVDERPWVNQVIQKYPNINPHFYNPTNDDLADAFEQAHHYSDVPLSGSSFLSQYFVMKLAAGEKVKVLLDGQGADEYLAGYMHSFDRLIGDMLCNAQYSKAIKTLNNLRKFQSYSMGKTMYTALKCGLSSINNENNFYRFAYRYKFPMVTRVQSRKAPFKLSHQKGASRFDDFLYNLVFNTSLPSLLHFEDRNSMAFGIESRVPFLDHRLVEYAFTTTDEYKIFNGETKYVLRHSLNGILPEAIVNRRDKKGFVTPGEEKWLRGPLKHLIDIDFKDYDFIDNNKVKKILEDYKSGRSSSTIVWRLAALHYWLGKI